LCAFSLSSLLSRSDSVTGFGVDEYLALKDISEIAVSPEGDFVAYTLTSKDLKKDEDNDVVWMMPAAGGNPVRMSSDESEAGSPKWSPDGKYLAILSDRKDDTDQVWLLDRRGGDAQQLTKLAQGVESFDWSPDSKQMLLVVADATPADLDKEERPNPRPWVIDRLQFKEDYVGYLERYRTHVHIADVGSGDVRQITHGDYDDDEPAWSPDGSKIVFVSNRTDDPDGNRNTDLWLVDVDGEIGEPDKLTSSNTADASPAWSPTGQSIVYTSTDPDVLPAYAIPQLTTIDVETREPRAIESLAEIQVFTPRYSPDGKSLLAISEERGEQNLIAVDVVDGSTRKLIQGEETVIEFDVGEDGEIFALITRPGLPDELFALSDGQLTQLSSLNKELMDGVATGAVEKFSYESPDGVAMESFVTFPPDYKKGKTYPGLLMVHGGPQAQYDYRFDFEAQLLASQGYVVVMPNPRGSWGYGQAFSTAIYRDWGGIDYEDVVAAMDYAIDEGWVDANRTGVFGWSYGGILTNHIITKTDRFKAAITGASATLYMANYGHDQYQRWWEEELGLPWLAENRDNWDRISPFFKLDKVTTPTLIVGGEQDWNVPIHNSEQLYIALKRQGVPTELVVYPDQGHQFEVPSYEKDLYERYIKWFEKWLCVKA
jgi:dipeptidyl aminopeptidase/acylaminoacyl peptidase